MQSYNREGVGRFYITPRGDYPSVTTVLGAYGDHSWLDEWRNRIGADKADAITLESSDIGTHLHYLFECFCEKSKPREAFTAEEKTAERMFKISKAKLEKFLAKVLYMEEAVFSHEFRIAGRFDMLCKDKNGRIVLVDYKNTKRQKSRKDIESYRQQLAFYRIMIKETLSITVDVMRIFMVNREGFVQIFDFYENDTPRKELVDIRKNFWEKNGC